MDFDEYNRRIAAINSELELIAEITAKTALRGAADVSNKDMQALLHRQSTLIRLSAELNEWALKQLGM